MSSDPLCLGRQNLQEDKHERVLFNVYEVIFCCITSDRADGLCMPFVSGGDVVAKICEGVSKEGKNITVPLQDAAKE